MNNSQNKHFRNSNVPRLFLVNRTYFVKLSIAIALLSNCWDIKI